MADPREAQFKQMLADFPLSPIPYLSLGQLCLSEKRYGEAVDYLEEANRRQPEWAAALVALGDAYAAIGQFDRARATFAVAREVAVKQKHPGLAEEIDEKVSELE